MRATFTLCHAPVSLLPTAMLRSAFQHVVALTPLWNTLVDKISRDEDFLLQQLQPSEHTIMRSKTRRAERIHKRKMNKQSWQLKDDQLPPAPVFLCVLPLISCHLFEESSVVCQMQPDAYDLPQQRMRGTWRRSISNAWSSGKGCMRGPRPTRCDESRRAAPAESDAWERREESSSSNAYAVSFVN